MHFILSDNGNYDLDIKIGHYGFVDFINDVIDFGCLEYIICFRIKEKKKKDTFYIKFYSTMFLQSFSFLFFNIWIIIMKMCVQFIIVSFYDEFITNKVL